MGASCQGIDAGCCKGNTNAEEIVSVGTKIEEDRISILDNKEGKRASSIKGSSQPYNQTTYIQNNINVYGNASLDEVKDLQLPDGSVYSGQVMSQTQIRQGFGTQEF